ncbi:MAG: response regulator [Spartobacteria bacterium]|nr:response regulator [Spartobacteria bacterium]
MFISVHKRILLIATGTLILCFCVLGTILYHYQRQTIISNALRQSASLLHGFLPAIGQAIQHPEQPVLSQWIKHLADTDLISEIVITDIGNNVIAAVEHNRTEEIDMKMIVPRSIPIFHRGQLTGHILFRPRIDEKDQLADFMLLLCGSSTLLVLAAFILFYYAGKQLTRPITDLSLQAVEIANGHLDLEVEAPYHSDFILLANAMESIRRVNATITDQVRRETVKREKLVCKLDSNNIALAAEIERRKAVQRELIAHHNQLESIVRQRTSQLSSANEKLVKAIEEARHLREKAETANHAKSRFLANMSHEIRTPMNAIIGFSELLQQTTLTGAQKEYLSIISDRGRFLLDLITEILDISKIEANKIELNMQPFILEPLVQNCVDSLRTMAEHRGIDLSATWDQRIPSRVIGDPTRIGQILQNITSNALKFTNEGSVRIDVSMENEIAHASETARIHFDVVDTGIGIPTDKTALIFEKFTQLDNASARGRSGVGLGLAIAHELVEIMHGSIQASSAGMGQGSTVSFSIPLTVAGDEDTHDEPRDEDMEIPLLRILCVDDEYSNRLLLKTWLERKGHTVLICSTAKEAFDAWHAATFDLIITDIEMPGQSGYELAEMIRRNEESQDRHVIIIGNTAHVTHSDIQKCYQSGMDKYLSKPVNFKSLNQLLYSCFATEV